MEIIVQATIAPFISARGTHPSPHVNAIAEMAHQAIVAQVFDNRMSERDYATWVFREHIAEVQSEIAEVHSEIPPTACSLSICVTAGDHCATSLRSRCLKFHFPGPIRRRSSSMKSGSKSRPRPSQRKKGVR